MHSPSIHTYILSTGFYSTKLYVHYLPYDQMEIRVTSIESVNFKARGDVIMKANAIHKETGSLSGGSS